MCVDAHAQPIGLLADAAIGLLGARVERMGTEPGPDPLREVIPPGLHEPEGVLVALPDPVWGVDDLGAERPPKSTPLGHRCRLGGEPEDVDEARRAVPDHLE